MRPLVAAGVTLLLLSGNGLARSDAEKDLPVFGEGDIYYQVDSLNAKLPAVEESVNLQTPQSALENFILASREGAWLRAAQSMNFNLIARGERAARAEELAQKLYYVVNQTFWIDWKEIPDRPDGEITGVLASKDPMAGKPRRTISIGTVDLDGRDVEVNLARVREKEASPVWLISAQTVENIDALYEVYGPGLLDRYLPEWAKVRMGAQVQLYQWIGLAFLLFLSAGIGWVVQRFVRYFLSRNDSPIFRGIVLSVPGPMSVLFGLVTFYMLYTIVLSLPGPVTSVLDPLVSMLIIGALTWLAMRSIGYATDYVNNYYVDSIREENTERARKLLTNISVARRVLIFIAFFAGLGIALGQLEVFKTLGMSLLASAGVATVVLGIAAHNTLGNIFAGIQIAISQPVRIGDNVYFDGNWGDIEEITYTYLTLRTWDHRRLIIPLTDFLSRPIENWSKNREFMVKPIHVHADYRVDVNKVRDAFVEMARKCEEWDGEEEPMLEVVDCTEQTIKLRGVVRARDPYGAWDMYCRLNEQLVAFLRDLDGGKYLPRRRMETWQHSSDSA